MKKYTFIFAFIFLLSFNFSFGVPLIITNTSNSTTSSSHGFYTANTYLGFLEDGNSCNDDWVLPFIFDPGASLTINDGSFVFHSPFNNFQDCLSNFLGYSYCEPIDLDWDGQRFSLVGDPSNVQLDPPVSNSDYPAGLIGLSTGGVECNPSSYLGDYDDIEYIETSNSYEIKAILLGTQTIICKITYNRYGNLLATLNYD